ncbi:MAG: hypothetical protein R2867_36520 [Caldilineaceae bacterium]
MTLTVTVNPGWTFSGWSGDHAGQTAPVTIIMDRNKAVTATLPKPCTRSRLILSRGKMRQAAL